MPRNDERPALSLMREHRLREDVVERLESAAIDCSSVRHVDERKSRGREHVAGDDDVGAAEVHEAVAIGDGIWRPEELDGVAVVERAAPFSRKVSVGTASDAAFAVVHAVLRRSDAP